MDPITGLNLDLTLAVGELSCWRIIECDIATPGLVVGLLILGGLTALGAMTLRLGAESPPAPAQPAAIKFTPEDVAFYDREVLPILKQHCYKCHGGEKVKGNFSLATREGLLKGGDLGSAVEFEHLNDSVLVKSIEYRDDLAMPPAGKLPQAKIDVLKKWLERKAPYPATSLVVNVPAHVVPKTCTRPNHR